jgi:hypothetical protein
MLHFLKHIALWGIAALPDIANLILVLVGVVMSLPKLAERIEEHKRKRYGVAFGCVVLGLGGFVVSVNQRQQSEKRMETLVGNVNTLVKETGDLVGNTNALVSSLALVAPQVAAENARIAALNIGIEAAKEKHDPGVIAALQARSDAAQKLADNAPRQFAVSMMPRITQQMNTIRVDYEERLTRLNDMYYRPMDLPADKKQQRLAEIEGQRNQERVRYESELSQLIPTADYFRQQLLRDLPQTPQDKAMEASFAKALSGDMTGFNERAVASYLDELGKR